MTAASPTTTMTSDATFSMLVKILYLFTRLCLPPMILAHVSLAEYGLWSACFILVGYIGMLDLGLSSIYIREVSRLRASGDIAAISRVLSTGIGLMMGLALVLLAVLCLYLPSILTLLHIAPALRPTAQILVLGTCAVFLVDMSLSAFAYSLHGLQQFRAEQRVWTEAILLELVLIAAFLYGGMGIHALLAAFLLRYAYAIVMNMRLAYRALPGLQLGPRHFDRSLLRGFLSFGMGVQASSMLAIALHSVDKVVAGLTLGPSAIAVFDLGGKLPASAVSIPASINQVTLPAAAHLAANQQPPGSAGMRSLYLRSTRSIFLLAGLLLSFLAAFAAPLCAVWLGDRSGLESLPMLMTMTALSAQLHIATGPGTAVFRGSGNLANEFVYHALRVVLIGTAVTCAWIMGAVNVLIIGAALNGAIAVAALTYMSHNHRALGAPLRELVSQVLFPGALPLLVGALLFQLWSMTMPDLGRFGTLAALCTFGVVHLLLSSALLWLVLQGEERQEMIALLQGTKARLGFAT